jgi:hypothetical protein
MSEIIVASSLQKNEKLSGNCRMEKASDFLDSEEYEMVPQFIEYLDSGQLVKSSGRKTRFNWLSKVPSPLQICVTALIGLGCFGIIALLVMNPDKCGRVTFGLTVYAVGEAHTEYDGQCSKESPDSSPLN